jgi:hypothetical protein
MEAKIVPILFSEKAQEIKGADHRKHLHLTFNPLSRCAFKPFFV